MKFYEYNRSTGLPLINEVNRPTDVLTDDPIVFFGLRTKSANSKFCEKYCGEFLCAMWEYKL